MKILIVDDHAESRKVLRLTLAAEGHEVIEAVDGQEALEKLNAAPVDVVISDILMPRMDGYRFCYEARRQPALQEVPIIIYSSTYSSATDESVALNMGADRFLRKPAPAAMIIRALSEVTAASRPVSRRRVPSDELGVLKQYSERLVQKLEERNVELEEAREKLERSEKRTRELIELAPIGIFESVPDGAVTAANTSFSRMLGYDSPEDLVGLNLARDIYADSAQRRSVLEKVDRLGSVKAHELKFKRKDGTTTFVQADGRAVRDPAGRILRYEVFILDITERKQSEEALRTSEERYRFLFESNPQPMWVFDEETLAFLAVNEAACRHYGYSREEFRAMRISDIRMPEDVSSLRRHLATEPHELQRSGGWKHRLKSGALIDVDITSHPLVFDGRPAKLVLSTDVTERKKAEEALRDSEQRFRQVTESIDEVFWLTDVAKNEMIYISPAYERIWGRAREDLYRSPQSWMDAIHPEDQLHIREAAAVLQASGEYDVEYRIVRPDGALRWIHDRAFPIRDGEKKVYRIAGVAEDVTENRQSESQMRRSEERFRRLFESNTIGIAISDLTGRTLEANSAYIEMLGYSREELVDGKLNWADLTPPEHRATDQNAIEALQKAGVAPPWEKELIRKDGTRVPVLLGVAMLKASEANRCIAYIVDLSKSRQLEAQLRQAQKMEAVGQLAGGIAHDFNNLLTAILGYTELVGSRLAKDPAAFEELEEVRKAGERAAVLTRQLLAFSRRQVLEQRVLDLNAIVTDLEKMITRLIGEDIDLVTTLEPSLERVRADAGEIEQIVMNLAVNSRDAMLGGGKITIETANVDLDAAYAQEHATVRPGRHVMLAVSDTGVGMDAETKARIFEPFFTTKAKDRGTGLGLSTVYGIVKQSNGSIWVYSEPGRGTTIKIYLPAVDEKLDAVRPRAQAEPVRGAETILLVEDETPVRRLAQIALENMGYTVLAAASPIDALAIARTHPGPIDLILTDVVMPELVGTELAAQILGMRPKIRILYMSGYTDDAIVRHKVIEPGTRFLQKPFTPATLARKVREALS